MADAWLYNYTDFGEGLGRSPLPVLRAVVGVATPGASSRFSAIIDTGGPITVVAPEVLRSGGNPVGREETMLLRLGGSTSAVELYDLTLEVRRVRSSGAWFEHVVALGAVAGYES